VEKEGSATIVCTMEEVGCAIVASSSSRGVTRTFPSAKSSTTSRNARKREFAQSRGQKRRCSASNVHSPRMKSTARSCAACCGRPCLGVADAICWGPTGGGCSGMSRVSRDVAKGAGTRMWRAKSVLSLPKAICTKPEIVKLCCKQAG
jgi:hypothetical protein